MRRDMFYVSSSVCLVVRLEGVVLELVRNCGQVVELDFEFVPRRDRFHHVEPPRVDDKGPRRVLPVLWRIVEDQAVVRGPQLLGPRLVTRHHNNRDVTPELGVGRVRVGDGSSDFSADGVHRHDLDTDPEPLQSGQQPARAATDGDQHVVLRRAQRHDGVGDALALWHFRVFQHVHKRAVQVHEEDARPRGHADGRCIGRDARVDEARAFRRRGRRGGSGGKGPTIQTARGGGLRAVLAGLRVGGLRAAALRCVVAVLCVLRGAVAVLLNVLVVVLVVAMPLR
mmetsp:Transcript_21314/g.75836  ORF Transcript_21314/g.75836 Transcript_21314/m.75836 type:complete len:283 (+) Transcript_21314:16-864(+)